VSTAVSLAGCCADFYAQDWVATLLDGCFHPGGLALTQRTIAAMELPSGARVLEVACGAGGTAVELARCGYVVTAVDLSTQSLGRTRAAAEEAKVSLEVLEANASDLPFADGSFDAVICECAVSTFTDPAAAIAEMRRVLTPAGRVGISDMIVNGTLVPELLDVGPWTCLSGARSVAGYQGLFESAGLRLHRHADETATLPVLATEVKRRLVALGLGEVAGMTGPTVDLQQARELIALGLQEVGRGNIGYARMIFACAS